MHKLKWILNLATMALVASLSTISHAKSGDSGTACNARVDSPIWASKTPVTKTTGKADSVKTAKTKSGKH